MNGCKDGYIISMLSLLLCDDDDDDDGMRLAYLPTSCVLYPT